MAYNQLSDDAPEQRQIRQRQALIKRMRMLSGVLVISVVARVLLKPPPPPKAPDRSKYVVRTYPGMIEQIPATTLEKMDPKVVAQIRDADIKRLQETMYGKDAKGPAYQPADVPLDNLAEEEAYKKLAYTYAKKRVSTTRVEDIAPTDLRKKTLILFRGGGFLKAEKAALLFRACHIQVDSTFHATLPSKYVNSVSENALTWKEPIPNGFVQLKPARGITITVARETARRIRIPTPTDEI